MVTDGVTLVAQQDLTRACALKLEQIEVSKRLARYRKINLSVSAFSETTTWIESDCLRAPPVRSR